MTSPRLGAHVSAAGGAHKAFERAREIGAECFQIFTRAPGRWDATPIKPDQVAKFLQARNQGDTHTVLAHDIYLTNLAAPDPSLRERSLTSLITELKRCDQLNLDGLVCHMGAHNGAGEESGLETLAAGVGQALSLTEGLNVPLLLESTAGQGTCLGHRFEHLARVLELNHGHQRLGVCLDTCHMFAAGYDLRDEEAYLRTWQQYDHCLDRDRLRAIHLNDSKKPLGSRVDRHAHIGEGHLGQQAFRLLVGDPRLSSVPMFLETPEMETMHRANLDRLKGYREERSKQVRTFITGAEKPDRRSTVHHADST